MLCYAMLWSSAPRCPAPSLANHPVTARCAPAPAPPALARSLLDEKPGATVRKLRAQIDPLLGHVMDEQQIAPWLVRAAPAAPWRTPAYTCPDLPAEPKTLDRTLRRANSPPAASEMVVRSPVRHGEALRAARSRHSR